MSKKNPLAASRRHVFIYDEDWDWLYESFGPYSTSRFGVSRAVRNLIHATVSRLKARENIELDGMISSDDVEIEI